MQSVEIPAFEDASPLLPRGDSAEVAALRAHLPVSDSAAQANRAGTMDRSRWQRGGEDGKRDDWIDWASLFRLLEQSTYCARAFPPVAPRPLPAPPQRLNPQPCISAQHLRSGTSTRPSRHSTTREPRAGCPSRRGSCLWRRPSRRAWRRWPRCTTPPRRP